MADPTKTSALDAALEALEHRDGPLRLGAHQATALVREFGSPLYAFDAAVLRRQIERVRQAFGPRVDVLLALKANPNVRLAQVAQALGCGAEVASAGEVHVAVAAGFAGQDIHFAGPGKSDEDLATARRHGVGCINVESEGEYERLRSLGARVSIRVNPNVQQSGSRLRMADGSSRFGVDRERVADLAVRIVEDGSNELAGLHVYAGSQSFEADAWAQGARDLLALASEVEQRLEGRQRLTSINFGGGFGWPVYDGDPTFDLEQAGASVRQLIEAEDRPDRRYAIELGRYLLAPCGVYLTRVVDLKLSGGQQHVVLDGGMHHHGAAAGLGAVMRRAFAIQKADDPRPSSPSKSTLGGPLCTPADRIGKGLRIASLNVGDVVAVFNSGAYGLTYSPTMFLGHPTPAEVVVDGERALVARERGRPEDTLRGQRFD